MPTNDPAKQRAWSKAWYEKNKEKHKAGARKNRSKAREAWLVFKASLSCAHCGFSHPAVIDFHHVVRGPGTEKVNKLVSNGRFAKARQEAQENCIALCSNCHRLLHWEEDEHKREARRLKLAAKKRAAKKSFKK